MAMSEIHEKLSIWAKLHKQWTTMESGLRSMNKDRANAASPEISAMEVELRALRAKVDVAFDAASAAVHNRPKKEREGPT